MDIYKLSRSFWDYAFENPEKIKPNHIAMYFFAIEHCNRLGWKTKFGFPSTMVMEAISVKSYNTYINTLNDLVSFGFIEMIEKSKNQYSANIIALSKFNKANDKALDKAMLKHLTKRCESIVQSNDSIDIHITNLPINNNTNIQDKPLAFSFFDSLISLGAENQLVSDWIVVRKNKKLTNTKTALNGFLRELEISGKEINEVLKICTEKSWGGYNSKWEIGEIKNTSKKDHGIYNILH